MSKLPKPVLDSLLIEALAQRSPSVEPEPDVALRIRHQLFKRIHAKTQDFVFVYNHEGEWVSLMRGVELKLLRQDDLSRSYLVRMAPGARIPPHEHPIDEECLVLEGSATINGVECGTGDYHLARQGNPHDWLISEQGCLLFVRGAIEQHAHHT